MAAGGSDGAHAGGAFAPLREPVFRRVWTTSLLSNFGQLILGVGVAWEMTRLTSSASMVALVQTALMLPLMLVAVPAGAIADMFDRRKVAMTGLGFSMVCAAILTTLATLGLASPWVLLAFCSLIGAGVALYSPSWQASIGEQVEEEHLPAAVALGTISYNVARSFGPALGGLIVLAAGARAAFAINAICYLPLFLAFLLWKRRHIPSRLPPERIDRAIVSGARYAFHSRPIRTVLVRAFLFGLASATATALAPLVAKDLLHGDASTYGIMLGASGVGAVLGALLVDWTTRTLGVGRATQVLSIVSGIAIAAVGLSHSLPLTCLALAVAGGATILMLALFNISVHLSAPRWVTARAISLFSSALTGGVGIGAWIWGEVANGWSIGGAVVASGIMLMLMPILTRLLPLPETGQEDVTPVALNFEPTVTLPLTLRSGPIIIEVEYDVASEDARDFYDAMREVQRTRLRNGGFGWSLARDIGDPSLWTERYHYPTWGDYLRTLDRLTQVDLATHRHARSFDRIGEGRVVCRRLERPFGSVRWRADSPDMGQPPIGFIGP